MTLWKWARDLANNHQAALTKKERDDLRKRADQLERTEYLWRRPGARTMAEKAKEDGPA